MTKHERSTIPQKKKRTIERNIPLTDWRKPSADSQLIGELHVGDSILFDDCSVQNLRALASRHHGRKFAIRTTNEGFRIWRTE